MDHSDKLAEGRAFFSNAVEAKHGIPQDRRNSTLDAPLDKLNSVERNKSRPGTFQSNVAFRLLKKAALNKQLKQGW